MAAIQGLDVNVEVSTDGTTWKTLICETKSGVSLKRDTTSAQTKCNSGAAVTGLGALSWSFSFDAVADDTPGAAQATYSDLQTAIVNGTMIHGRINHTEFKHEGQVYVTDLSLDASIGETVKFSGTLSGTGALTIA